MGIVIRQSFWSTLLSYVGVGLGIITSFYLFPHYFSAEQYGLINILLACAGILLQFGKFGLPNIMVKYYPFFKDQESDRKAFFAWCLKLFFVGLAVSLTLLVLFKSSVLQFYNEKSPLFGEYYFWLLPLFAFYMFQTYFEVLIRARYEIVFSALVREVLLRVFIILAIIAFVFFQMGFNLFIGFYVLAYLGACLVLLFYILKNGWWQHSLRINTTISGKQAEMINFGFFTVLSEAGWTLTSFIDTLMIGALSGLAPTAVYRNAFYMASIVQLPQRSITGIILPLLADHWKHNRLSEIEKLYKQSSLQLLILGLFILLLIWCNADTVFSLMPATFNDHGRAKYFVLLFGLAKIFDMMTSINGEIIQTSKHFRFNLYLILSLLICTVVANYFLIPRYQLMGAAIAAFSVNVAFNLIRYFFVKHLFDIHPFSVNTMWILMLAALTAGVTHFISYKGHILLALFFNSGLVLLLFVLPVIVFKLSKEINLLLYHLARRAHIEIPFLKSDSNPHSPSK